MKPEDNSFIEVFLADEVEEIGERVLNHFCLEVDDVEALREKLLELGYAPGEIKMGADNSWQFWIDDPNGLAIKFHQYTAKSSQFTGENVEVNW